MSNVSENMSKLEQEAQELVMKLRELNEQIGSYKEAKDSLQETNQEIKSLITATENLTNESGAIIAKFNEISGASFMERIEELSGNVSEFEVKMLDQLNTSNRKNRRRFFAACLGIAIIIALQIFKMFFIDKASFSQFLSSLRG